MRYVLGAVLVGALATSGCASRGESAEPTTPATEAPATSHEERALEAYRGLMDAVVEGSHDGATGHPDLAWYATGQALEFSDDMLNGIRATGRPDMDPRVTSADLASNPPEVTVEDCVDDSDWNIIEEDLEGLGPLHGEGFRPVIATVTENNGTWQVSELWLGEYGECER
ncbi:hypothetical protein LG943_11105 [Streptomonospora sp. S1-112]|uniref:Lipoprotein n=1 Tax=Streptomonospora mangrovi TaxID=2883123 RepID=A0A9X3SN58_9ACTN|nr:hypothetical protein [Streptomonospora mangrovi]MDA0564866.1 hypothetical protein [Streptomonospora mangrovi]